jgi:hypothetical protein
MCEKGEKGKMGEVIHDLRQCTDSLILKYYYPKNIINLKAIQKRGRIE